MTRADRNDRSPRRVPGARALRGGDVVPKPSVAPPERLDAIPSPEGREEFALLWWPLDASPRGLASLTAMEAAVAELALLGLSNEEIARARGRSARTVANQLASTYRKLGVGSRAELAAHVAAAPAPAARRDEA